MGLLYQTEMELYVPLSSLLKQNTIEWLREGKEIESLQMLVETVPRFDLAFVLFSSIFQTERAKTLIDVYSHFRAFLLLLHTGVITTLIQVLQLGLIHCLRLL